MPRINSNSKIIRTGWRGIDVSELERMRRPGYHHISRGLMPNATSTDKAKYEICQNILGYKQDNKLSEKELGKKLGIKSVKKMERLLYCHINTFSLDELGAYASKLLGSFELKVVKSGEEVHSVSQPKTNGRSRKHL